MAVRWIGVDAICGGRLREAGKVYDDLPEGTPSTVTVSEFEQMGQVQIPPAKPVVLKKDEE